MAKEMSDLIITRLKGPISNAPLGLCAPFPAEITVRHLEQAAKGRAPYMRHRTALNGLQSHSNETQFQFIINKMNS